MRPSPTLPLPVEPSLPLLRRLGWALADAWTVARRDFQHWRRQPGAVMVGWVFPIMIALMFGGLFGGAIRVPDGGSYFDFLIPGMFTLTMLFGLEATMVAVANDAARGITDRFRSMPMSESAVVLGRCIADMANSAIGLAIMIGAGLVLGWRPQGGPAAFLAAMGLLLLLRFALLWIGIFIGLSAKSPESVTAVQILIWPFSFLTNVFVDPATMPPWLGLLAQWNPPSATVTAVRALFKNPGWQGEAWIAQNAELMAMVWPLLIVAIFFPLSVYKFRRLNR